MRAHGPGYHFWAILPAVAGLIPPDGHRGGGGDAELHGTDRRRASTMTDAAPSRPTLEDRLPGADRRVFAFFQAWRAARRETMVPRRTDFDPLAIPTLLPHVWLYRYDDRLDDFVCRLAGEEVNAAWGQSIRGRALLEVVGTADHPIVLRRWRQIVGVPLIHYGAAAERLSALETRSAERLLLPLASDGDVVDHVLGISLYRISGAGLSRSPLVPEDIIQIPCAEL